MTETKYNVLKAKSCGLVPRLILFIAGFIILSLSFVVFYLFGYLSISWMIVVWAMIVISTILMIFGVILPADVGTFYPTAPKKSTGASSLIPALCFIVIFSVFYVLHGIAKLPGTDEINIDYYAGYLVSHGVNPYVSANMQSVFTFMHFPEYLATPLLNGGLVTSFSYPALIAIVFSPASLLHLSIIAVPLTFTMFTFLILFYVSRRQRVDNVTLSLILIAFSAYYSYLAIGGVVDSVWVFFGILAFLTRNKPSYSGIFYGLSLAAKQVPIVILPFFLYLIFRENRRSMRAVLSFLVLSAASFLLVNIPFILTSPGDWVSSMLSVMNSQLIGVGFGPSALDFVGYVHISRSFFTFSMLAITAFLVFVYLLYYDRLKYTFFVFPIIIFLFNYRVETDYLNFWPMFLLPVLAGFLARETKEPDRSVIRSGHGFLHSILRNKRLISIAISIVLLFSITTAAYHYSSSSTESGAIKIVSIQNFTYSTNNSGKIVSMTLDVYFNTPGNASQTIPALFAIYEAPQSTSLLTGNTNPLLWTSASNISSGHNVITITPKYSSGALHANTPFRIVEYYEQYSSSIGSSGL